MKYCLAIDFGTSAIKSAIYDKALTLIGEASVEYELIYIEGNCIEVSLERLEKAFQCALQQVVANAGISVDEIATIGFSSSAETMVFLDDDKKPIRNAITWMDTRAKEETLELIRYFGKQEIYARTAQPTIDVFYPAPKLLWLSRHEHEGFQRVWKIMFMKDYFIYQLTGHCVCDDSVLNTSMLWDIRTRQYWKEMLAYIGIDEGCLPKILPQGSNVDYVSDEAMRKFGLSTKTMVNIGAQDQMCGALGAGNTQEGMVSVSLGSAMMVLAPIHSLIIDQNTPITCSPSAIHGQYMMNGYSTGAICMRWFRDRFCREELEKEMETGANAYTLIDAQIAEIPLGCEGLRMLPYLQGTSMPISNDRASGVYFGITPNHGKFHFARAIMEGVAMSLRDMTEVMEKRMKSPIRELLCLGGGAKSEIWMRIFCDVVGLPVKLVKNSEAAACRGAAILAAGANFVREDLKRSEKAMKTEYDKVYTPDQKNRREYERIYHEFQMLRSVIEPIY